MCKEGVIKAYAAIRNLQDVDKSLSELQKEMIKAVGLEHYFSIEMFYEIKIEEKYAKKINANNIRGLLKHLDKFVTIDLEAGTVTPKK